MSRGCDLQGVLSGLRVIELAGLGPAPFCGMLLADMGADVVRVERPGGAEQLKPSDILVRGRSVIELNLKDPADKAALLALLRSSSVLIEGFRPGVMERLGLGPDACLQVNPGLVYARMTGWGQHGPLAARAGHDINYIAISGVLNAIGPVEGPPAIPLNIIGDFGGGGMMLAMGVLAGVLNARATGKGQVIDAAMTDGTALLSSMMWGFMQSGQWQNARGANLLDGAAHFYTTYACADGKYLSVGAIEPQFYAALIKSCGLENSAIDHDYRNANSWAASKKILETVFKQKTRDQWCAWFEGQDVCVAPVLDWHEAAEHPHNVSRQAFVKLDGLTQPAPAPRFDRTPSQARPFTVEAGGVEAILKRWS